MVKKQLSTQGASIAKQANVETLILSHLPQYGDNQKLVTEAQTIFDKKVLLAKEGLVWE